MLGIRHVPPYPRPDRSRPTIDVTPGTGLPVIGWISQEADAARRRVLDGRVVQQGPSDFSVEKGQKTQ
ncbi:hypothetical protein GCM10023339_01930 [Alloalcanivorax gelatiniphagus]